VRPRFPPVSPAVDAPLFHSVVNRIALADNSSPRGTTKPKADRLIDLVADAADAHTRFKRRVTWTQKERDRFIERYTIHPKRFRLIAKELPDKSVKDVIEFYYLNKFVLCLKEKEMSSKRCEKAKVTSEGAINKGE
jgi:hypothetical protein